MSNTGSGEPYLGIPGIDSVVEIGRSTTHTTYRVRDIASGRVLVVKLLNAGRDWPGLADRFEREQNAMAGLSGHPNIISVLGHGWTETGMPYIVTDEAPGGSIGDRLRGPTPMTGPDILSLGVRLAGAVESAHRAGVVHGDLRPDDMRLTEQGEPTLADFGVVTLVRPNAGSSVDPQELAHVSPELLDGQPATVSSDIYALGSALFTLFAGEPAYVRPGETSVIPAIKRISSDPLPDLSAKNVPEPVAHVISKAMSKNPAERHHSAQELGRALQQAQLALGLPMTEMTMLGNAGAGVIAPAAAAAAGSFPAATATQPIAAMPPPTTTMPGPAPVGAGPPPSGGSGNKTPLIVGGVIAAVLLIGGIVFFATRGGDSKPVVINTTTTTKPKTTTTTTTTTTTAPTTSSGTGTTERAGFQKLFSDDIKLVVDVPTTWSDTNTQPTPQKSLSDISAGVNLTDFFGGTYIQPGVEMTLFPTEQLTAQDLDGDVDALLDLDRTGGKLRDVCTEGIRQDVTTGEGFTARQVRLSRCNGAGDVIVTVATNNTKQHTLLIEVHVGQVPDETGADSAINTAFYLD